VHARSKLRMMACFRHWLPSIAGVWLWCHVALLAAPTIVFVTAPAALLECTCTHGEHAVCPMHHRPAAGSTICLIQSADHSSTGVLASIFTFVGVLTSSVQTVAPQPSLPAFFAAVTTPSFEFLPPDSPPPRA
jgi:hypothetical protein